MIIDNKDFDDATFAEEDSGNATFVEENTENASFIEEKTMRRNKNYCPMCGTKYPSERSAFCHHCRHPREVEKT